MLSLRRTGDQANHAGSIKARHSMRADVCTAGVADWLPIQVSLVIQAPECIPDLLAVHAKLEGGVMTSTQDGMENYARYFGHRRHEPANDFERLTVDHLFGQIYGRSNNHELPGRIDFKQRALINISLMAAFGRERELRSHLRAAVHQGFTRGDLVEIMIHVAHYVGWPAAHSALKLIDETLPATTTGASGSLSGDQT